MSKPTADAQDRALQFGGLRFSNAGLRISLLALAACAASLPLYSLHRPSANTAPDGPKKIVAVCSGTLRPWDGGGGDDKWSTAANWCDDTVPLSGDTAVFDGTSTKNCTIDAAGPQGANINLLGFHINTGYTGIVTQGSGVSVSVGTNTYFQSTGTFDGSNGNITFNGNVVINAGGTFTGGSGNIDFNGNFSLSGDFTASSGTTSFGVQFGMGPGGMFHHHDGTAVFDGGDLGEIGANVIFNNLTFSKNHNVAVGFTSGTIVVTGTLTLADGIVNNSPIRAEGDVSIASTFDGGSAGLSFTGTANQTYTNPIDPPNAPGPNLTNIWNINKTSGTLTAANSIILGTSQSLNIKDGTLYLSNNSNLTCGALTLGEAGFPMQVGKLVNDSATTITLGGNVQVLNNSKVDLQGGGAACPQDPPEPISLRSSVNGTRRTWSGSGAFRLVDVDVKDMGGATATTPAIKVFNGFDSGGNNNSNWTFDVTSGTCGCGCPTAPSITPLTADVTVGNTTQFTAAGDFLPRTFSVINLPPHGSIHAASGVYTATSAGTDTVRVTDGFGNTADATVNVFNVPAQLSFIVQPSNATEGQTITPAIKVAIQDQFGNTVQSATNTVTLVIQTNPGCCGGGTLAGTIPRNADHGIATFNDLSINRFGNGYTLQASSGVLTTATSNGFNIANPFLVTNTNDSGTGSLRQQIINANNTPGTQVISFNIPGTAPFTISPVSLLPEVIDPVVIDGTTQPGYSGSPIVELRRDLVISAGNSAIRGLVINMGGVYLITNGGNTIQGNYIGTNVAGDTAQGSVFGVHIASNNNHIGGATAANRNVISGNSIVGVSIGQGSGNVIQGNYIGTNATGTAAVANATGVSFFEFPPFSVSGNTIGGSLPGEGNVISGNSYVGISLIAPGHIVQGNLIGTNASGTSGIPNAGTGVLVATVNFQSATNITIGGTAPGERNVIAFNGGDGINIFDSFYGSNPVYTVDRVSIRGNSIYSNGNKGINLGVWFNDSGDADKGANTLQNYPVLTSADSSGGTTTINGTLNSTPSSQFTLDFYSNSECGPFAVFGQGKTYLGSADVATEASGITGFNVSFPQATPAGYFITATATDIQGNTSEFARCRSLPSVLAISGRLTDNNGAPLAQTFVSYSQNANCNFNEPYTSGYTLTNSNGNYSLNNLAGGACTFLAPYYPNDNFAPSFYEYFPLSTNQTSQDFVGTKARFSIKGQVRSVHPNGAFPLANVLMTLSIGGGFQMVTTDNNGYYSFDELSAGNYVVTPPATPMFSPASRNVTILDGDATNADFTNNAQVQGRLLASSSSRIYAMNADASGIVAVGNGSFGSFSPDGQKIAFSQSDAQIYKMNSDGSAVELLTSGNPPAGPTLGAETKKGSLAPAAVIVQGIQRRYPAWSPDGLKIAFVKDATTANGSSTTSNLIIMNSDGTSPTVLYSETSTSANNISSPSWSSDGSKLVFTKRSGGPSNRTDIFTINSDGTQLSSLTGGVTGFYSFAVWSPNGNQICYLRRPTQTSQTADLVTRNSNGSNPTLIGSQVTFARPTWSPDSSLIAFLRPRQNSTSIRQIVIIASNGVGGETTLTPFISGAGSLSWGNRVDVPTPTGVGVNVLTGGVAVSFNNVTSAGTTTITTITPASAGSSPSNFVVGRVAYEITTTATYFPPIQVCFNVPTNIDLDHFLKLSLMHNEGGVLVDRTTSRSFNDRRICGTVDSLSPFALAEQMDNAKPSITGLVRDNNGNPLSDVSIQLTGTETAITQTDSFGMFHFVNLTQNGNYNVQPRRVGYLFTEYNQDLVNLAGDNAVIFTGTQTNFAITGKALDENADGVGGVEISLDGATTGFATTDVDGNYTFTDLPADGAFSLTAFKDGFGFTPVQQIIDPLTNNQTEVNFTLGPPACAFGTSSSSQFFLMNGGSGSVNVTAGSSCSWTALASDSWITIVSADDGTGDGVVDFEVRENFSQSARQATINISGQLLTIVQDGGLGDDCNYSISPGFQSFLAVGGSGLINVNAEERCAWQAVSSAPWVMITSNDVGIGNDTVSYSVATNPGPGGRAATITIGGKVFSVKQKGP